MRHLLIHFRNKNNLFAILIKLTLTFLYDNQLLGKWVRLSMHAHDSYMLLLCNDYCYFFAYSEVQRIHRSQNISCSICGFIPVYLYWLWNDCSCVLAFPRSVTFNIGWLICQFVQFLCLRRLSSCNYARLQLLFQYRIGY